MKRILYLISIGTLALGVTAWGDQDNHAKARARGTARAATAQTVTATPHYSGRAISNASRVNTQRSFSATQYRPRNFNATPQINSNAVVHQNNLRNRVRVSHQNSVVSANANIMGAQNTARLNRRANLNRSNVTLARARNFNRTNNNVAFNQNLNANRVRNFNRQRNITVVNNWRSDRFRGQNYVAFRNYRREWHDRGWWNNHCSRVIFISGGWWAWNSGYWYPAWGYDPYAFYPYDGPIYTGYAALSPDQVVVNVQEQLQRDGYYVGTIDGILGPQTRQAIAAYQADHGLAVTAAVDEPTLETLGLS